MCAARGLPLPPEPQADVTLEELSRRGRERMESLHAERSRCYAAPGNKVAGALYGLAIQDGYGAIWFRPGLTLAPARAAGGRRFHRDAPARTDAPISAIRR